MAFEWGRAFPRPKPCRPNRHDVILVRVISGVRNRIQVQTFPRRLCQHGTHGTGAMHGTQRVSRPPAQTAVGRAPGTQRVSRPPVQSIIGLIPFSGPVDRAIALAWPCFGEEGVRARMHGQAVATKTIDKPRRFGAGKRSTAANSRDVEFRAVPAPYFDTSPWPNTSTR